MIRLLYLLLTLTSGKDINVTQDLSKVELSD